MLQPHSVPGYLFLSGGPKGGGGPLCPHYLLEPLLVKGDVSAGWSPPPGELKAKGSLAWLPSLRETLPQPDGPHTWASASGHKREWQMVIWWTSIHPVPLWEQGCVPYPACRCFQGPPGLLSLTPQSRAGAMAPSFLTRNSHLLQVIRDHLCIGSKTPPWEPLGVARWAHC